MGSEITAKAYQDSSYEAGIASAVTPGVKGILTEVMEVLLQSSK